MTHIALLLPDMELGGAQRIILRLAGAFAARGHRVDVVVLTGAGGLRSTVPEGVRFFDLAARSYGLGQAGFAISGFWRLAAWLRRERPAAMLSTITGANLVAAAVKVVWSMPAKLVLREASSLDNVAGRWRLTAMRMLYPRADKVIALSAVMAAQLHDRVGVEAARLCCIANPVDAEFVRGQALAPVVHPWVGGAGQRLIVSVGRLTAAKDYPTLLRAFAGLPADLSTRLLIVGDGPERARLAGLAEALAIGDRMQFVGADANPWRWMARADLFAMSSRWEGCPNALLEALALGVPAVATEYDASVHAWRAYGDLSVAPVGNHEALGRVIAERLRAAQRTHAVTAFALDETVSAYLAALGCAADDLVAIAQSDNSSANSA